LEPVSTPPVKLAVTLPGKLVQAVIVSVLTSAGTFGVVHYARPETEGVIELRGDVRELRAQVSAMQKSVDGLADRVNRGDDARVNQAFTEGLQLGKHTP
jgi:outer membrane murein-binding lipoprotein Lpp